MSSLSAAVEDSGRAQYQRYTGQQVEQAAFHASILPDHESSGSTKFLDFPSPIRQPTITQNGNVSVSPFPVA
jgi:hypothetical protein